MRTTILKGITTPISKISLGTSLYGGVAPGSREESAFVDVIKSAVQRGVTFIDGARGYLDGRCEEFLGRELNRLSISGKVAVSTKLQLLGYEETLAEVEKSRTDLNRDCIDVMYIHWPRTGKDARPMMEALEKCRAEKKIALIGVSNFSPSELDSVLTVGRVDMVQLGYNLLWRIHEKDLIPYCLEKDILITTYSSLAQGVLAGKFSESPHFGADDNRNRSIFFEDGYWPSIYRGVEEMKGLAEREGCSLAELAMNWLVLKDEIASVVASAKNVGQLDALLRSAECDHSPVMAELTAISDRITANLPSEGNIFQYYP